jgi:hypothetical protein
MLSPCSLSRGFLARGWLLFDVDTVCINQNDPAEKSQQISRMDQIYHSSVCVLMWIGDVGSDGRFALQWLRELQDARTQGLREINEARMQGLDLDEDKDAYRLRDMDRACHNDTIRNHWPAIRPFFLKTYWRRVWILQEAIAKEDSLICYGAYGIPWSFLRHLALGRVEDMQEALSFRFGRRAAKCRHGRCRTGGCIPQSQVPCRFRRDARPGAADPLPPRPPRQPDLQCVGQT